MSYSFRGRSSTRNCVVYTGRPGRPEVQEKEVKYIHSNCGGTIDVQTRTCRRCKKKWNPISFRFTLTEIRPIVEKEDLVKKKVKVGPTTWVDKVPAAKKFSEILPRWPRWARIISTVCVLGIVIWLIVQFLILRG